MEAPESGVVAIGRRRNIEYKRFGARDGRPVVYSHGLPGSANEAALADDFGKDVGLDLIALSRPGIGKSTFQPNRKMTDWPEDVQRVADALHVEEFELMGMSGGGPYALVCAERIHTRALATQLIASPSQLYTSQAGTRMNWKDKTFLWAARWTPFIARAALEHKFRKERRHPGTFFSELRQKASAGDQELFDQPEFQAHMIATIRDVIANGAKPLLKEIQLLASPWGFDVRDIPAHHPVIIMHGSADDTVPLDMSRELSEALPHAEHHSIQGEGHFMIAKRKGKCRQLLAALFKRTKKQKE